MQSNVCSVLRAAAALALAGAAAHSAFGYAVITDDGRTVKWPGGTVTFQVKVGTSRTLQDGSNFSTSFIAAMNSWNAVMGQLQFAGNVDTEGAGGEGNGINETFFAPNVYGEAFGENTIAVTTSFRSGAVQSDGTYRRTQSDVIFNNARSWDSYRGVRQGNLLDFRRVALHELGHVLGLDHPNEAGQTVAAVMNSTVGNIDSLQQDDIDGAQFLYGTSGSVNRPANNDFANASTLTLTNNATTATGSSVFATKETGEPNHAPSEVGGASIWWRWQAPSAGSVTVTTAGSNFDTLLAAYTGNAVNALTQLAANDDVQSGTVRTSTITFNVTGGTTYHLAVDGWQGEWGSVTLNVAFTPSQTSTAPAITSQPQNQTVTVGGTATFSVTATGTPAPTYQWLRNGTAINGATNSTLTLNNVQTGDAGNYTVTVTNSAGSVTSNPASLTVNAATPTPAPTPTPTPPAPSGGGGGGGGAPSHAFLAVLMLAIAARALQRRRV